MTRTGWSLGTRMQYIGYKIKLLLGNTYFQNIHVFSVKVLSSALNSSECYCCLGRPPQSEIFREGEKRSLLTLSGPPRSCHIISEQHSAENHKMRFHLWILIFIALATDNSVEGRRRKKGL